MERSELLANAIHRLHTSDVDITLQEYPELAPYRSQLQALHAAAIEMDGLTRQLEAAAGRVELLDAELHAAVEAGAC